MKGRGDTTPGGSAILNVLKVRHGAEILRLAMPTVLTMLSQTLMWTVDTALLGRVSSLALAASGLGGIITWACYSLLNNLSRISQTFVAQAHGKGDDEAVGNYLWQGIYLSVVAGFLLQAIGFFSFLALPLTRNASEIQDLTYVYIKWRTVSAVATQLTFCLMGFFQGRRDVKTPMWTGIVANVTNLVLDIWLIFGWSGIAVAGYRLFAMAPLGVKGAAIATSVGQVVNVGLLIFFMLRPAHRERFRTHLPRRPNMTQILDMIRIGLPAAFEGFIDMAAFMFFSVFVGRTGTAPLAANQITIQILAFSFMPMWGITIAGSVLVGNWIGGGRPDKAEIYARQIYKIGIYYTIGLACVLIVMRHSVFRVFTADPEVLALGAVLAVIAALFQVCDGLRMISVGVLQGAGDTRYPMLLSLAICWGGFIPLTWVVVELFNGDVQQAWLGGTLCYLLEALFLYFRFASGRWKNIRIFSPTM